MTNAALANGKSLLRHGARVMQSRSPGVYRYAWEFEVGGQFGAFILHSTVAPRRGEIAGAHLLDLAPTLLELGGYDVRPAMQGRSFAPLALDGEPSARQICLVSSAAT